MLVRINSDLGGSGYHLSCPVLAMVGYGDSCEYINPDTCGGGASFYLVPLAVNVNGGAQELWWALVTTCPVLSSDCGLWGQP